MPQYLISDTDEIPKYARIAPNGKAVAWVGLADATPFSTPETARLAFDAACQAMADSAAAKLAAATAAGKIGVAERRTWKGKHTYGAKQAREPLMLFAPIWLCSFWIACKDRDARFPLSSRATRDDLLGVFELFYVRSDSLWLGRAQTKAQGPAPAWLESFSFAIPFYSAEAAAAAARVAGAEEDFAVVKTSCVFTEVMDHSKRGREQDDVCDAIASACEARDIRESLQASVAERFEAAAREPAAKRASRL